MRLPSGLYATTLTEALWPLMVRRILRAFVA